MISPEEEKDLVWKQFKEAEDNTIISFFYSYKSKTAAQVWELAVNNVGLNLYTEMEKLLMKEDNKEVFVQDKNIMVTEEGYQVALTKKLAQEFFEEEKL